jgi:oligopeptide/dipeptide ABC transporter ATP-binding protein
MLKLKEELDTAIILITHDLGIISEMAQRVIVMYAGEIVEEAVVGRIFENPLHPYTRGLLQSVPRADVKGKKLSRLQEIPGVVPSLNQLPKGCLFYPRCPETMEICRRESPERKQISSQSSVRCWQYMK